MARPKQNEHPPKASARPAPVGGDAETRQRLAEIAEQMKTARGSELDALVEEVDRIIGFDTGDSRYDPETDAAWQLANRSEE